MDELLELRRLHAVNAMTESIIWAQPAFHHNLDRIPSTRTQSRRTAAELSKSRWGMAVLDLGHLAAFKKAFAQNEAGQLFVEASQKAYDEVQAIDPEAKLILPEFLSITNEALRQQVAIYYQNEAA